MRFFNPSRFFPAILLLVLSAASPGQTSSNATINGTVHDGTGLPIASATVTISNDQLGIHRTEATDSTGHYSVLNIAPGSYDLKVQAQGFTTLVRSQQQLEVGSTTTLDFALPITTRTDSLLLMAAERK